MLFGMSAYPGKINHRSCFENFTERFVQAQKYVSGFCERSENKRIENIETYDFNVIGKNSINDFVISVHRCV